MADLPKPATAFGQSREAVFAFPAEGQTVYRVLAGEEPELWDFKSHAARGDDRAGTEPAILWVAISTLDRSDRAWKLVARGLGRGVAAIELAPSDGVSVARTRRRPGHYSVWGEAELLLARAAPVAQTST